MVNLMIILNNMKNKCSWQLVAAVLLRGDNEEEFKNTNLYKKALWLSTNTNLTFEEFQNLIK